MLLYSTTADNVFIWLYAYIGCRYNVKVKGKEWSCDACPHRNFWKLFAAVFSRKKRKKRDAKKPGGTIKKKPLSRGKRK